MITRASQIQHQTISYLVSAIANICDESPNNIIDHLVGLLWDEELAGLIKRSREDNRD